MIEVVNNIKQSLCNKVIFVKVTLMSVVRATTGSHIAHTWEPPTVLMILNIL